jgi:hypothetical protein
LPASVSQISQPHGALFMQPRKSIVIDDAMWRKCNTAAAATMGGASASSFVRFSIQAMLDLVAQRDAALRGAFKLIDESERERESVPA